jgi:hypothetical protein
MIVGSETNAKNGPIMPIPNTSKNDVTEKINIRNGSFFLEPSSMNQTLDK